MEPVSLLAWETVEFPWGVAVRHRKGSWETLLFPDGQEMDVSKMNVILHDKGIEFVEGE